MEHDLELISPILEIVDRTIHIQSYPGNIESYGPYYQSYPGNIGSYDPYP